MQITENDIFEIIEEEISLKEAGQPWGDIAQRGLGVLKQKWGAKKAAAAAKANEEDLLKVQNYFIKRNKGDMDAGMESMVKQQEKWKAQNPNKPDEEYYSYFSKQLDISKTPAVYEKDPWQEVPRAIQNLIGKDELADMEARALADLDISEWITSQFRKGKLTRPGGRPAFVGEGREEEYAKFLKFTIDNYAAVKRLQKVIDFPGARIQEQERPRGMTNMEGFHELYKAWKGIISVDDIARSGAEPEPGTGEEAPGEGEAAEAPDGTSVDAGDQIAARMVHSTELGGVATAPVDKIVKGFKKKERERNRNDIESVLKAHPIGSVITSPATNREYVMVEPKRGMLQAFENTPANQKKLATVKRVSAAIVKLLKNNPKLLQAMSENKQLVEKVIAGLGQEGYFDRYMPVLNERFKFNNNSSMDTTELEGFIKDFIPFAQKEVGWNKPPTINFVSDSENANEALGKTAHYNPSNSEVTVFVDSRHPKDILRSLSHELVHHAQNCRGDLDASQETPPGYAQEDGHLRNMEKEAYLKGNLALRDWEDSRKKQLQEANYFNYGILKEYNGGKKVNISEDKLRAMVRTTIKKVQEEQQNTVNDVFAPNHYCVHHGGVQHEGKIVNAKAVAHNWNKQLGKATAYDMRLPDGTILENVSAEDIQVTDASLAEEHGGHVATRDEAAAAHPDVSEADLEAAMELIKNTEMGRKAVEIAKNDPKIVAAVQGAVDGEGGLTEEEDQRARQAQMGRNKQLGGSALFSTGTLLMAAPAWIPIMAANPALLALGLGAGVLAMALGAHLAVEGELEAEGRLGEGEVDEESTPERTKEIAASDPHFQDGESLNEWKNKELNHLLLKRFKILK